MSESDGYDRFATTGHVEPWDVLVVYGGFDRRGRLGLFSSQTQAQRMRYVLPPRIHLIFHEKPEAVPPIRLVAGTDGEVIELRGAEAANLAAMAKILTTQSCMQVYSHNEYAVVT